MADGAVRVAIIGWGFAGRTFHAPVIAWARAKDAGVRLVAVVSSQPKETVAAQLECYREAGDAPCLVLPSVDALVEAKDAWDVAVVTSPNESHAALAARMVAAGRAVVVEKPLAVTVAEAEDVVRAVDGGARVAVFQNRRWDGDFLRLKQLLAEGTLGAVRYVEMHFDRYRLEPRDRWRERDEPGAGLLHDLGPHLIDQALLLFGSPSTISAEVGMQRPNAKVNDFFHIVLAYDDGLRVVLHASILAATETPRFLVQGTKGSWAKYGLDGQEAALRTHVAEIDGGAAGVPMSEWATAGREAQPATLATSDDGVTVHRQSDMMLEGAYWQFYKEMALHVRDPAKHSSPVRAHDALRTQKLIALALASAASGRREPVSF